MITQPQTAKNRMPLVANCWRHENQNKGWAIAEMAAPCGTSRIFAMEWGYLSLMHCFSVISQNITVNHIMPKIGFLLQTVWV